MSKQAKATKHPEEIWESGELGQSLEYAQLAPDDEDQINRDLELHPISIRLERSLIDAFKFIASHNKEIGYQPLMRQVLRRFAVSEIKRIAANLNDEANPVQREDNERKAKVA